MVRIGNPVAAPESSVSIVSPSLTTTPLYGASAMLDFLRVTGLFFVTAVAEIVGC